MTSYFTVICPECGKIHKVSYSQVQKVCDCGQMLLCYLYDKNEVTEWLI
jgi:hypothetical protein